MKSRSFQALGLILIGIVVGWLLPRATAQAGSGAASRPVESDDVVARVGDTDLTARDVEAARPEDFLRLARQRHQLTEETLDRAIAIRLVELEADARGTTEADLILSEVDAKVTAPTDAEKRALYEDRGLQGSYEQLEPQIRRFLALQDRDRVYAEFLDSLRERFPVETFLDPFRSTVETEGFPAKGPEDAPVTIVEFADFECPYCRELVPVLEQVLEAYAEEVRFVYRQFPLTSIHANAQKAAEASLCAREQGKFWEMHDAMFRDQSALHPAGLKATAASLGLDSDSFDRCLDSGQFAGEVAAEAKEATALGLTGTPGLFINGRFYSGLQTADILAGVIDEELERAGYEVEGRRIEPRRFDVNSAGFPSKGAADAPVTIVEFADFQCPYCRQLLPTLQEVIEAYEDEVRFVFRHYPIASIHPEAQKASEAAACAGDQGRFWEMHDAMYADQSALAVDALKRTARELGLDGNTFDECLDSGKHESSVLSDLAEGRSLGIRGTPAYYINGRFLQGVHTFETLSEIIDEELERAREPE